MKITPSRLSAQQGSSISVRVPFTLDAGETIASYRISAYIKSRPSDSKIICLFNTKVDNDTNEIVLSVSSPYSDMIPAGQLVYYIELLKGNNSKTIERNFINVEP